METLIEVDQVAPPDITHHMFASLVEAADLSTLGEGALVPFVVRRLANPSVAWVNWSWFCGLGLDVTRPETRRSVQRWLVDSFAYCVYDEQKPSAFLTEQAIFHADRYGCGAGTGPHGGSGRVATVGRFQVKGIGPTPLTVGVSQESYANGCLWLEEGIREAILAEVADAEFPHGAVPVIAIISTGIPVSDDPLRAQPRGLLVRPAVMRPAHLERASLFASRRGREDVAQDVARTHRAHASLNGPTAVRQGLHITVESFSDFLRKAMDQVAFGHVHRLFHGGYFSSNLAINGELHDYGSFRSLPDWRLSQVTSESIPFGREAVFLHSIAQCFELYGKKYGAANDAEPAPGLEWIEAEIKARRMQGLAQLFGLSLDTVPGFQIASALEKYFNNQQLELRNFAESPKTLSTWIYDAMLAQGTSLASESEESEILREIWDLLLQGHTADSKPLVDPEAAWSQARRLLQPRPFLYREVLQGLIFQTLDEAGSDTEGAARSVLNYVLSTSRRIWPKLEGAEIAAQVVHVDGAALLLRYENGSRKVAVEGIECGNKFVAFGQAIANLHLENIPSTRGKCFRIFEGPMEVLKPFGVLSSSGEVLEVPAMGFQYVNT